MKKIDGMLFVEIDGDTQIDFPCDCEVKPKIDGEGFGLFNTLSFTFQNSCNAKTTLYLKVEDLEKLLRKVKKREQKFLAKPLDNHPILVGVGEPAED